MALDGILSNKIAVVTGAGQGIGRALALALAEAGASVAIADIQDKQAQGTADLIEKGGGRAAALHVDVTDPDSVRDMFQACVTRLGGIDILVNNAGIFPIQFIPSISAADWDRVMAINLKGTFLCSQAALECMRMRGGGRIINIASVSGLVGAVGFAHYAASKAGVIGFTKSLAREVANIGITANAVAPGIIDTGTAISAFPAQALEYYKTQVPLRSLGHPEDLTGIVVFLASPASAYITGQTCTVDGGYTMQ
jgi:NAD(P)-dependent dehydrogenase (short-subunit alcohol dehydrogenase family)